MISLPPFQIVKLGLWNESGSLQGKPSDNTFLSGHWVQNGDVSMWVSVCTLAINTCVSVCALHISTWDSACALDISTWVSVCSGSPVLRNLMSSLRSEDMEPLCVSKAHLLARGLL